MGCGASRLGAEGQAIPARFRPLLRGRIDNIRRRRNATALTNDEDHCSKKELLMHGREEDDNSQSLEQSVRKSVASREETTTIDESRKREPEKIIKEDTVKEETKKEVSKETTNDDGLSKEGRANTAKNGEDKVIENAEKKEVETEEKEEVRHGVEAEGEEEEDEGYYSYEEGEQIGYGSPSFRVYFTNNLENDKDDDLDFSNASKDASSNNRSQNDDEASQKECLTDSRKKGSTKRRNFKRVIPGRGQVKKLWNVRSCYTKPSRTG